jgi:hypothetical protein
LHILAQRDRELFGKWAARFDQLHGRSNRGHRRPCTREVDSGATQILSDGHAHFVFDPRTDEGIEVEDRWALVDAIGQQKPEDGLGNAELTLNGLGRQSNLPANVPRAVSYQAAEDAQLHSAAIVERQLAVPLWRKVDTVSPRFGEAVNCALDAVEVLIGHVNSYDLYQYRASERHCRHARRTNQRRAGLPPTTGNDGWQRHAHCKCGPQRRAGGPRSERIAPGRRQRAAQRGLALGGWPTPESSRLFAKEPYSAEPAGSLPSGQVVRRNVIAGRDLPRADRQSSMKILGLHLTVEGGGLAWMQQRSVQSIVKGCRARGEVVRGEDGAARNVVRDDDYGALGGEPPP